MSADTVKKAEFELLDDGRVVQNVKGREVLLAMYEKETGTLTFESVAIDRKYRVAIQRAVTEDTEGILSGNEIVCYAIKGRPEEKISQDEPLKPKADKMLGDKTPKVVEWFFKWRPQEAYARYGVQLDASGKPRKEHCRRVEINLRENTNSSLVEQYEKVVEREEGIIAARQTHMTFTVDEIVGAEKETTESDE